MTGVVVVAVGLLVIVGVVALRRGRPALAVAERSWDATPGERNRLFWGYRDTAFEFCGPATVRLTGARYPLAGSPLPDFVPYVERMLGLKLRPEDLREPVLPTELPEVRSNAAFMAALAELLPADRRSSTDGDRLAHSHGQLSVDEIYRIARGELPPRVVDAVVWPQNDDEIEGLIALAEAHDVVLIPYGGGTNVSGALMCPGSEERMVVAVDMALMDRVLEIDRENDLAVVEAGITGRELEARLEAAGYTSGHIPDSIEFSTLGGWIATHASGMKKNRYGNIEEVVREAVLITPQGAVSSQPVTPRHSVGIQPRTWLFGHEGGLGIITRATIQVHRLPECRQYASFVFRDFASGLAYLHRVQREGIGPASIRLANNTEFRLGRALAPHATGLGGLISRLKSFYVLKVRGFAGDRMVASTIVMEGSAHEVRQQWQALTRLGRALGGLPGGAEGGRRGYQATFAIAYIRDFLNRFGIIGETFETSAPWSCVEAIVTTVEETLHRECAEHGVQGYPYLSYRVSQSYPAGVCIYFTMGFSGGGLADPAATYQAIEHRLRAVILEQGGSLSHHHGVGKVRQGFVAQVHTPAALSAMRALKAELDPRDVFASANHAFGLAPDEAQDQADSVEQGRRV